MPELLDLYCCGGGASVGYARAGFTVTGVDIAPQPEYPYRFVLADAVEFVTKYGGDFDAIAASPPCQYHSDLTKSHEAQNRANDHVDLLPPTRAALRATGKPYIIENVAGAARHMLNPARLCGLMFGLNVFRHRMFEANFPLQVPPHPSHRGHRVKGWRHGVKYDGDMLPVWGKGGYKGGLAEWQTAMGIDWITKRHTLVEAIPPAFTEYLGTQLRVLLEDPLVTKATR